MARLPRLAVAGELHLVTQRARPGVALFDDATDRQAYLDALREAARQHRIAIHAYGLLDTEARLLVTPPTADALGRALQSLGRRFGAAYNRRHARSGGLWAGRYRAVAVEPASQFLSALRYVEADAARASSAAHHAGERSDPIVTHHTEFWRLGNTPFEREVGYRAAREQVLTDREAAEFESALRGGWPMGSGAYRLALEAVTGQRIGPRVPGRKKTVPE